MEFKLAFTINEACTALAIGRTTLYACIKAGELEKCKHRGRSVIPYDSLKAYHARARGSSTEDIDRALVVAKGVRS